MKFQRRLDFFKFYKIVKFDVKNIEISDNEEIISFLSNMLKICSCRIETKVINSSFLQSEKFNNDNDKYEIFTIFINLSNNIIIFNFQNENNIQKISFSEGICIDLSSNLIFSIDKKNIELLKVSIYNK
jgi:hypothetical protein